MKTNSTEWIRSTLPGLIIVGGVFTGSAAASLIVSPTTNPLELADSVAGTGITINGVDAYTYGAAEAFGTFSNGLDSAVGIDAGLVLSTGNAVHAEGPNRLLGPFTDHGTTGLPGLSQFLGGTPTYDAALMSFTFDTHTPGSLDFAFSVGSSECCGVSDAYSFLLDGKRAFVGSVSEPRTYAGYSTAGFSATYASFGGGTALAPNDPRLGFNWISDLFNVSFGNLEPGRHSLVIAIGDGTDGLLDSTLFVGPIELRAAIASPPTGFLLTLGLLIVLLRRRQVRHLLSRSATE